jgi:hypothetical protein
MSTPVTDKVTYEDGCFFRGGLTMKNKIKKLPMPFAVEVDIELGRGPRLLGPTTCSDGWYLLRSYCWVEEPLARIAYKGGWFEAPEGFDPGNFVFMMKLYEHGESCGAKHPELAELYWEGRDANRFLLQVEKFEDQAEWEK